MMSGVGGEGGPGLGADSLHIFEGRIHSTMVMRSAAGVFPGTPGGR
jgi:hypothetical protein